MSKDRFTPDWNEEYRQFLESSPMEPPRSLTEHFKQQVTAEFNPSWQSVFAKLFAIHFFSGALTLFFCPQFGFGVHTGSEVLFAAFFRLGEYGCMLACGGLFLGTTGLLAAFCLSLSDVRAIKKSRGLQWAMLAFLSLGFFFAFREQEAAIPLGMVLTWVIGALFGGISIFQGAFWLRVYFQRR